MKKAQAAKKVVEKKLLKWMVGFSIKSQFHCYTEGFYCAGSWCKSFWPFLT